MSTFTTSRNTRGQHVSPRFESRRYRPSPARSEAIFGKVIGIPDYNRMGWRVGRVIVLACAIYALKLAVMG